MSDEHSPKSTEKKSELMLPGDMKTGNVNVGGGGTGVTQVRFGEIRLQKCEVDPSVALHSQVVLESLNQDLILSEIEIERLNEKLRENNCFKNIQELGKFEMFEV